MSVNEKRSLKQRFPTLLTGLAVLLVVTLLLSCRTLFFSPEERTAEPVLKRQTVNADTVNVPADGDKSANTTQGASATVQDGIQYVNSTINSGRYEPITVQQGIPVKWTLNVPSGSLNSCNNSITIPKYNLQIKLKTGENVIEFTPDESGTFPFSCWMGMIRSSITVIGEDGKAADNPDDGSNELPAGCCGAQ